MGVWWVATTIGSNICLDAGDLEYASISYAMARTRLISGQLM
jgi:hypothetical protein